MFSRQFFAFALALPLGACAALGGSDSGIYGRLTERDVTMAAQLMQSTLEQAPDGTTRQWANRESGHKGAITPTRTYLSAGGYFCRDYREELTAGGETGRFSHTACRDDDGGWVWI